MQAQLAKVERASMLQIEQEAAARQKIRVRFNIIRNARISNVGNYQSCMVSELRIIWKQTVRVGKEEGFWYWAV